MPKKTYLRGGVYYSDFYVGGKRVRKKLSRDPQLAEKMAEELETSMQAGGGEPDSLVYGMLKICQPGDAHESDPNTLNIQIKWDPQELLDLISGKKTFYVELRGIAQN